MAQRIATMTDCWEAYKSALSRRSPRARSRSSSTNGPITSRMTSRAASRPRMALHEFFRHTDFIDAAAYTMATGWFDFDRTRSVDRRQRSRYSSFIISASDQFRSRSPATRLCPHRNTRSAETSPASMPAAPPGRSMSRAALTARPQRADCRRGQCDRPSRRRCRSACKVSRLAPADAAGASAVPISMRKTGSALRRRSRSKSATSTRARPRSHWRRSALSCSNSEAPERCRHVNSKRIHQAIRVARLSAA